MNNNRFRFILEWEQATGPTQPVWHGLGILYYMMPDDGFIRPKHVVMILILKYFNIVHFNWFYILYIGNQSVVEWIVTNLVDVAS
jgi:hypothetical protein